MQNRAALNLRLGRTGPAQADAEQLVRLFPSLAVGFQTRAACALASARLREASSDYARATKLDPGCAEAWLGRAVVLAALGQLDSSSAALEHARALDADAIEHFSDADGAGVRSDGALVDPRRIYLVAAWERQQVCNWRDHDTFISTFNTLVRDAAGTTRALRDRALLFAGNVLPVEPATRNSLAADVAAEVRHNARLESAPFVFARSHCSKLRLAYLSANFREHPAAHVMEPLLVHHDRERFEIHGYSMHGDDSPRQQRLASLFDRFHDLSTLDDADAAQRIHANHIDVLVDSSGYLQHGRAEILAMRPAPVRISYIGFPGSLGRGICDYRVSDVLASPDPADGEFSEALIRLPHAHLICDGAMRIAAAGTTRAGLGLPDDAFVFACHNNTRKIEPGVFALRMRILTAVPETVLWLLDGPPGTSRNLRAAATELGVEGKRLCFTPRVPVDEYRGRLALADLFLDTHACNGHVTINDALLAGVPVLTLRGEAWAGRIGASQVSSGGLAELAVESADEYIDMACRLARDVKYSQSLRARLARREAPLFDTARRVGDYERGILAAWARHTTGLQPEHLDVGGN